MKQTTLLRNERKKQLKSVLSVAIALLLSRWKKKLIGADSVKVLLLNEILDYE